MSEFSSHHRLDTLLKVETPEAVDIYLRPASVFARARAYALDLLIRVLWFVVSTSFLVSILGFTETGQHIFIFFMLLNLFFVTWLYSVLFEVMWNGQTPGKKIFGLKVVNDNGTQVSWSASLLRNLLRLFDALPFFYGVGMTVALSNPHGRRLGDLLASTVVVYVDKTRGKIERLDLGEVEALPPPVALTREEQQAVLSFVERRRFLTRARTEELAQMMALSIFGREEANAERLLLGLAKYYAGEERKDAV